MDECFCPNCGAILNDQNGFDQNGGTWVCTECGNLLMDDDTYYGDTFDGIAWFCDNCNALLNKQDGFSDSYGSWTCTECSHVNGTTEDDMIDIDEVNEYYCPNCGAILNDQYGFDPDGGIWNCTECGKQLLGDDTYYGDTFDGIAWFCDNCNAFLNKQDGFSDSYGSWTCTECGHVNGITEEDIIDHDDIKCPNCGESLKNQWEYNEYDDDYTCSSCGAKLHREYSTDPYSVIEEDDELFKCPNCGDSLKNQWGYNEYDNDYTCSSCGAKLHREYSTDPYSVIEEDDELFKCPNCGDSLKDQYGYNECDDDYTCDSCGAKLHRDYDDEPYSIVGDETDNEDISSDYDTSYNESSSFPMLFDPVDTPNVQELQQEREKAERISFYKNHWLAILITFSLLFVGLFGYFIFREYQKLTVIGFGSEEIIGTEYNEAVKKFTAAGFTNIEVEKAYDLNMSEISMEGTVKEVTIGIDDYFNKSSKYPYDTKVQIVYHVLKNVYTPVSSKEAKKMDYKELFAELENAGFVNITLIPDRDLITGWIVKDGSVESITINGDKSFSVSESYRLDAEVVITYHTFKE